MKKNFLFTIIIYLAYIQIYAGNLNSGDSIVLMAMKHEMTRNMKELVFADYEKSFFISYTIGNTEEIYASATLGAIIKSKRDTSTTWAARVMVGDYAVNDENYEDYGNIDENEMDPIDLTIEKDYMGIRRTLWTATNYIYKKAALSHKNKILALKNNNLNDSALQIDDFSKTELVKIHEPSIVIKHDLKKIESIVRDLSKTYLNFPEIVNSNVVVDAFNSRIYFINSEGTESITSEVIYTLKSSAQIMDNDGNLISNHFAYHFTSIDEMPDIKTIVDNINAMVNNLYALKNAPVLEENYYGHVLFTGQTVAHIFEQNLFTGTEKLIATREPLVNTPDKSMYYGNLSGSIDAKINRRIATDILNVKALPKLNEYHGQKLLGSFKVDAEGVVPPDELMLIKDGILLTLLNDRTPTRKVKNSNGHKRYSINYGGIGKQTAPGVISISCNESMTYDQIKETLINRARKEGLEYGIIMKPVQYGNSYQSTNVFRIWTDDRREELVSSAFLKKLPENALKRILGTVDDQLIYNTFSGSNSLLSDPSLSRGLMITYMTPSAVLFEESEIISIQKPVFSSKPIVESPVKIVNYKKNSVE